MSSQDELHQALLAADAQFDDEIGLLRGVVGPTRYHTRLEPGTAVHPTRESMIYAAALLESPESWRRDRGLSILNLLLALQDSVPSHATCGIWPWYLEERLDQMAPPDWNWADFLGVQLVRILQNDRLAMGGSPGIEEALRLAAGAIRKRDVRLSYTNIAIMGIYVCVMAGRLLSDGNLLSYGRGRLRKFVHFTREAGGFPEYNSPTYTVVSLVELTRMLRDFDEEDLALVRQVHDTAWKEIALHWHGPSRQWAGPHSRSYSTLLQPETLGFLQRGLAGRVEAGFGPPPPSLDWCRLPVECPRHLLPQFAETRPRFHFTEIVSQGEPPLIGHTHAEPEFVLSSAERGTFWNQARPLVAYAPANGAAAALAVRFLHDGYDFCSANLLARQSGSRVLAAVCLAHDGGDKHGDLDRLSDGRISGEDWRLRFELRNVAMPAPVSLERRWDIAFGDSAELVVHWLHSEFGVNPPRLEMTWTNEGIVIDVILYSGPRRAFHFHSEFPACLAFGLGMSVRDGAGRSGTAPQVCLQERGISLHWEDGLELSAPRFPLSENQILEFARRAKDGIAISQTLCPR